MAGRLARPVAQNLQYDPNNASRATVQVTWAPDDNTDNQVDMVRFRLRWVYSEQATAPNDSPNTPNTCLLYTSPSPRDS